MSEQFDGIMEGLNDLLEYAKGDTTRARRKTVQTSDLKIAPLKTYDKEEIKRIRLSNNLTMKSFGACLGVSPKTVESWEMGINTPSGAASRLLQILENKPNALQELEIISSVL
jgi:putative transcriptional regulator